MSRKKPLLWKCTYDNYEEGKINFLNLEKLMEGKEITKFQSIEKQFRNFALKHKHLMVNPNLNKMFFIKETTNYKGLYRNLSRLIIPVNNSHNYYKVKFYS